MHYDNPNHLNNVVDSSGIRMYYTEQLRQYDAGIVEIGVSEISIPPGESAYLVGDNKFGCPASCTNSHVPEEGKLTVFASMLHAHLAGRVCISKLNIHDDDHDGDDRINVMG